MSENHINFRLFLRYFGLPEDFKANSNLCSFYMRWINDWWSNFYYATKCEETDSKRFDEFNKWLEKFVNERINFKTTQTKGA